MYAAISQCIQHWIGMVRVAKTNSSTVYSMPGEGGSISTERTKLYHANKQHCNNIVLLSHAAVYQQDTVGGETQEICN